ncbi:hypothetical protein [Acrocarpospora macrocephala]|nr:hypothetical protein [Acrocarpospora macrocephala]
MLLVKNTSAASNDVTDLPRTIAAFRNTLKLKLVFSRPARARIAPWA